MIKPIHESFLFEDDLFRYEAGIFRNAARASMGQNICFFVFPSSYSSLGSGTQACASILLSATGNAAVASWEGTGAFFEASGGSSICSRESVLSKGLLAAGPSSAIGVAAALALRCLSVTAGLLQGPYESYDILLIAMPMMGYGGIDVSLLLLWRSLVVNWKEMVKIWWPPEL